MLRHSLRAVFGLAPAILGVLLRIYGNTALPRQDPPRHHCTIHTGAPRPAFPEAPPSINTPQMQELRRTNPAEYDKRAADSRTASADYTREYATFDDETIAAVDKFRKDRNLDYQGDAPGLVDARLIDALRSAYVEKRKSAKR